MKPLGEIVAALRSSNGWTLQELAERVRRGGAKTVKHQHLQQLESKPHTRPRYIVELAAAFGKSVEELHAWESGQPAFGPNHARRSTGVRDELPAISYASATLAADELALLEAYRACPTSARDALRVLASASRTSRR